MIMSRRLHETTDLNPKYIVYFGVGLVLVGLLIQIGIAWMFHLLEREQARRESQPAVVEAPKPVPQPRLQINPQGDLEELRRQEDEILSTYAWIDRQEGTVRIPIDRAIELFPERQKK
jgi:hypothetical protein